ncbi:MAG: DUF998 domain-containing protein [Thermoprotei archaeon]
MLAGVAGSAYVWIIIAISMGLNPWFSIRTGAFSDLGGPRAYDAWVYNVMGMMVTSALLMTFSCSLVALSENKVETVGSAFFIVASLFLFLIGYFHEGTYPHIFVSEFFFAQSDVSIGTFGLGLLLEKRQELGSFSVVLSVVAPAIAAALTWPSTAILEAFGIGCIELWVVLTSLNLWRHARPQPGRGYSGFPVLLELAQPAGSPCAQ